MASLRLYLLLCVVLLSILSSDAFTVGKPMMRPSLVQLSAADGDDSDTVARRIIVKGDVQGGYYRACVINEVSMKASIEKLQSDD